MAPPDDYMRTSMHLPVIVQSAMLKMSHRIQRFLAWSSTLSYQ